MAAAGAALVASFPASPRGRVALAAAASLGALAIAFEALPHTAVDRAWSAAHDAPVVRAPFDPASYPSLHGLLVLAVFSVAVAAAVAAAVRRPIAVFVAVAAGVGFPATLLEDGRGYRLGVLALAAALWAAVALSARPALRTAVPVLLATGLVCASAGLAVAGLRPGAAHVDWRGWDPFAGGGRSADLRYVWDANYDGIAFPARPTVVLRVRAPKRAQYWRVSTLETFAGDRWIESLFPVALDGPRRRLPPDPLVPERDRHPDRWLEQVVEVVGLQDARLAAASQPARIDAPSVGRLSYLAGGVLRAGGSLRRGTEYRVWSYAPTPTPRELAAAPAEYPAEAGRYLELGRARFPGFAEPRRVATIDGLFTDLRYQPLWAYRPLWENGRRVTARARSPYEATLLLERWFRSEGGFRYEELPPRTAAGNPPLVDFVEVTRAGYCQHYAGAMTVMLRMLGIPARVAVGFTAGTWKGGVWTVTDHQAHAWVEAWFPGHGWLPFDPTPGRGTLSAVYTLASDSADAVAALGTGRFLDFTPQPPSSGGAAATGPVDAPARRSIPWWLVAAAAAPFALGAILVAVKGARRARRLRRRDPRGLAAGVRCELVDSLLDRGATVAADAPTAVLQQIAQRVLAVPAGTLVGAIAEARYGRPEGAGAAARRARGELRRVLDAARARERPGVRLRVALSLRSLRPGSPASGTMGR